MTKKIVHRTQITWDWDQLNSAIKFGFRAIWTLGFASTFTFGELSMEEMFSIYLSNLSNLCKMTTLQSARPNLFLTIGVRCERWPIFVVFAWFSLQWFSPPWPRTIVYHFIQSSRLRLSLQLLLLILQSFGDGGKALFFRIVVKGWVAVLFILCTGWILYFGEFHFELVLRMRTVF